MLKAVRIFFSLLLIFNVAIGETKPRMRYQDKIRIREAIIISNQLGNKIWKGINEVPFVVLLVTDSIEYLINHPYPSDDFKLSENDTILNTKIFYRKRQFPCWYLATFPAVNGVNCIVVGTRENTNKYSSDWVITLLHEHFHQYQFTSQDYYKNVENLKLSGGDQTGMWQLNYAFPYDSSIIIDQYKKYTLALSKTLSNINKKSFKKEFGDYLVERNKFKQLLNPNDYRYFSFQIWQEGIAQYTEYKFLQSLSSYQPTKEIQLLPDFISFATRKDEVYKFQSGSLTSLKLEVDKRICFYTIGFAEGLLLDQLNPKWHKSFLTDKFYIEHYSKKYK